jgi:endonuclease YncB( thermonuclease family)
MKKLFAIATGLLVCVTSFQIGAIGAPVPLIRSVITQVVVQVYDGDGLWFEDGDGNPKTLLQVRLFGINAPEYNAPGGSESKQFLRGLIQGQVARCSIEEIDGRHNRPVGICLDRRGKDLACALVWYGHAHATHPKYYPCDRSRLPPPGPPPF